VLNEKLIQIRDDMFPKLTDGSLASRAENLYCRNVFNMGVHYAHKPEALREVPEVKALIEIGLELQYILEDAENRNIFGEEIISRLDNILKVFAVEK
jgi:hypothetical protein